MDKEKIKAKVKEKKVWMSALSTLAALGVLTASQVDWAKDVLAAIFGW
jgi:hypothetical protein